jgi:hypothetical protein
MFNNGMFSCAKMAPLLTQRLKKGDGMHETMARLYEAAKQISDAAGQSAVARLLNVSPQLLTNWERRGVSFEGMLNAQETLGCNAVWLRKGVGPMLVGEPVPVGTAPAKDVLAESLKLTAETAKELRLLTVHRLSNEANRLTIDIAVAAAADALSITSVLDNRQ